MPFASTNKSIDADLSKPLIDPEAQDETSPVKPCAGGAAQAKAGLDSSLYQSTARSVLLASATAGFAVQLISLASYSYLLVRWGNTTAPVALTSDDILERNLYLLLQCLSQVDLCVYSVVWVGFTLSLTTKGVRFAMSHVHDESVHVVTSAMRRFVFLLGVHCLVGLVLGAFVSWTLIDIGLGFAVPYGRIIQTVAIDLGLCYCMMLCYDCGTRPDDDDDDDGDEDKE